MDSRSPLIIILIVAHIIIEVDCITIVPTQVDKMRAKLANFNYCAVHFFKPRRSQLVLILLLRTELHTKSAAHCILIVTLHIVHSVHSVQIVLCAKDAACTILLTKITAAQNEVALTYHIHSVRGLGIFSVSYFCGGYRIYILHSGSYSTFCIFYILYTLNVPRSTRHISTVEQ